jgi:hypothetical protein
VLLGAVLLSFWLLLVSAFDVQIGVDGSTSGGTGAAVVTLLVAALLLTAAAALDCRGLSGPATPFVAVGNWAAFYGVATLGTILTEGVILEGGEPSTIPALLVIVVGVALIVVGSLTTRRFTLWHGAFIVGAGVFAVVSALFNDSEGLAGPIALLLFAGAVAAALVPVSGPWIAALTTRIRALAGSPPPPGPPNR